MLTRGLAVLRSLWAAVGARINCVPIRLKLALTFAGVMIVLFGVLFLLLYIQFAAGLDAGIKSSLETRAADLSAVAGQSDRVLSTHSQLPEGSGGFAQIVDPEGHVLASTPDLGDRSLLSAGELARAARGRVDVNQGERIQLLAYRPAPSSPNVLVVGVSTADRDSALASLQRLLFIGGPIALLIACFAGYVVAARALGPVESMRRRAARLCGFGSDERLPVPPARDEIQRLGQTLNEMLARLEEVVERGRAFVAGASHELRTPLTILQLELDEALSGDRSDEELREAIGSAREEVRRLTSLAEDLLVIAQSDHQRLPITSERFEVHRAMRVIAERYSHLEGLAGRPVTVEPESEVFIEADVARLDQALSNMVHNALRFGEGPVIMRAGKRGSLVELHVLDRGPGFSPEFLPHAFERFSRADPARSRGGTGLGLAIVRAIAEAHGGRVEAENRPGGGAHVWLTLPGVVDPARSLSSELAGATSEEAGATP
ncbi:MAG TPA: ATP-binding protein [Solirubrobacteraceae bacterium]|nr:ATP-binding protein [Solirubrobacteraceae bacterium]